MFSLVSSAGAKKVSVLHTHTRAASIAGKLSVCQGSWLRYPGTKGLVEDATYSLGWERFAVFRPALLLTEQREVERPAEAFFQSITPEPWTISTEACARGLVAQVEAPGPAAVIFENEPIKLIKPDQSQRDL